MSPASNAAKEKYAAVLEDAKIYQHAGYKNNRVMTGRHPSVGACDSVNAVNRRTSHSSASSDGSGRFKAMIKNILSPPAY